MLEGEGILVVFVSEVVVLSVRFVEKVESVG